MLFLLSLLCLLNPKHVTRLLFFCFLPPVVVRPSGSNIWDGMSAREAGVSCVFAVVNNKILVCAAPAWINGGGNCVNVSSVFAFVTGLRPARLT